MKKPIVFMLAASTAFLAIAAQNDALITFSTPGPDTYADGETVMDGECYALVWSEKSDAGAVFAADGSVAGGKLVLAAPVAKNGRCPTVLFEVDAVKYEKELKSGTWGVYLLDTRRWGKDGVAHVTAKTTSVNAADLVAGSAVKLGTGSIATTGVVAGAMASTATAVPDGVGSPEITGIRVEGAYVFVTAKGTVPCLQYDLSVGNTPDAVTEAGNSPRSGADSADEEVTFVVPAKPGASFFKVGRK